MGFIILLLVVILGLLIYITILNKSILNDNKYFQIYKNDLLNKISENNDLKKEIDIHIKKNIKMSVKIEKITNLIVESNLLATDILEKIKEILQITTTDNISK